MSKVYFSHSTRKLRIETLLCFRNFPVPKKFIYKKLWFGEYHDIPSEIFCGRVPKKLVGKFFLVFHEFRLRKIFCIRGIIHDFLSHSTRKLRMGNLSRFRNFLVSKRIIDKKAEVGESRFTVRIVLSHSAENNRIGILQCLTDSDIEKLYALEG